MERNNMMIVENCNVTIKLERNEVWTLASAMSSYVKERAKDYIEYKGTYAKGFWEAKPIEYEISIVRGLYYSIGEVGCYKSFEREIERMFEEAEEETPKPT
jgi:hypothetical protein